MENSKWVSSDGIAEVRSAALVAARDVIASEDPYKPAKALWVLGMRDMENSLGQGLWLVWGAVTDCWSDAEGAARGVELAREAAGELIEALGDESRERWYCDRWIYERLGASKPPDDYEPGRAMPK